MLNKEEQSFCETESFQSMQFIESNPKISNKCHGQSKLKICKIIIVVSVVIFVGVLIWHQTTRIDELNAKLQKQEQNVSNQSELLRSVIRNHGNHLEHLSNFLKEQANEIKDTKATLEDHQQSLKNHAGKLDFHYRASSAEDCEELFEHGINVSGSFNIDPDGRYQGMHSFKVICDFEKKVTRIQPKKKLIKISKSSTTVQYSPTMDQIMYLIEHSGSCYQEVSVQNASLQDVVWLDFKGRERNFSNGIDGKVQLWNFWLLPITGVGFKNVQNGNTSVTFDIGDITCSQTIHVNITGSLYDAIPDLKPISIPPIDEYRYISWRPKKVPVTFNIEFDIEVLESKSETHYFPFIFFEVLGEKINGDGVGVPFIYYSAYYQKIRIVHCNQWSYPGPPKTTTEIDLSSTMDNKKPQHVQVKQFIPNGSTKFYFVKFGHQVLYSGETKQVWNYSWNEDKLYVNIDCLEERHGARVTNLKITE